MATDLDIVRGLPFAIVIKVKDGQDSWPDLNDLEVRCQVRSGGYLVTSLGEYITTTLTGNDIRISLSMTGAETRELPEEGGQYDMVISDVGAEDIRAYRLLNGYVSISSLVTRGEGDD